MLVGEGDPPEMKAAYQGAQESFRYFWRELFWERHRIVPGCDFVAIKAPFSDAPERRSGRVEHMWLVEPSFDGREIVATLNSDPNWVRSVRIGDEVRLGISEIDDWLYVQGGRVYGGFTVHVLRAGMSPRERAGHDGAWGFEFGEPHPVLVPPGAGLDRDHPMATNMASRFEEGLTKDPSLARSVDDQGWTMLHHHALGGSSEIVRLLLRHGADRDARTPHGMTAADLAASLGWTSVQQVLSAS